MASEGETPANRRVNARQSPAFAELLEADKAMRAAAATAEQWLEVYRRAAGETLSTPLLDLLLREALEAIARILEADAVSLLLANPEGSMLVSRAAFGLEQELDLSVSIPSGAGVSGPILASGEPRIVDDLRTITILGDVLRASGHRSYVGVPLSAGGRTFGVLHATSARDHFFDEDDVEILLRYAEPIATAIERVRLFEAERAARDVAERTTDRIRSLQRITAALAHTTTVNQVCQTIINEAVPGPIDDGERAIWVLRESRLVLVAGHGVSAEYPEIPLDPSMPAGEILTSGEPLLVETRAELSRRWPVLADGATASFAAFPLVVADRRLGVMAIGFRTEHQFALDEVEFLTAIAEQAAVAVARAEGREALQIARVTAETQRERLDFLARASERLSRSLDLEVTLKVIADLAVPRLADRCALFLLEDDVISKRMLAPELETDEAQLFEEFETNIASRNGVGTVLRTGQALHVEHLEESLLAGVAATFEDPGLLQRVSLGGLLVLPLRTRGRSLGALAFCNRGGRAMGADDRSLAEDLGSRAALAIENAMLYETEAHIATRLAASLLPATLPAIDGLDIAVRYRAGSFGIDVGGDFYDVFEAEHSSVVILIGDVQGKGVDAAAVTGLARHTVRASAKYEASPAALLSRLNEAIIQNIVENSTNKAQPWASARLCTAAIIRLDRDDDGWRGTASSAGHPLPLIRHADGRVRTICGPGLLLGVLEDTNYVEAHFDFELGATLVLFTDGVSERHLETEMFGSDGIIAALGGASGSADQIGDQILSEALRFNTRREDDLVVLTVRV